MISKGNRGTEASRELPDVMRAIHLIPLCTQSKSLSVARELDDSAWIEEQEGLGRDQDRPPST